MEKTPCGPSTYTVVSGSSSCTHDEKSPSALTAISTSSRSALDENENGCMVSEKGERPNANHANWPGSNRNRVGGRNANVVVWPRSRPTRSSRQGRSLIARGLIKRTQTSNTTNAADMSPHSTCFHSELTYSSTKY